MDIDENSDEEGGGLVNLSLLDDDYDDNESMGSNKDATMKTDDELLQSSSNEDSSAMEVEHEESADGALASMIALKQSMQKKAQVRNLDLNTYGFIIQIHSRKFNSLIAKPNARKL